jgi:hypothetical protein
MIVLDEHFPESQRQLLKSWRISVRKIGVDVGRAGMDDDEIIPFLRTLRRPTFVTRDYGFYRRIHCHRRYCLICLEVGQYDAASFTRRVLSHSEFDTESKRMGAVVRAFHVGLTVWRPNAEKEARLLWEQANE